MAETVSIRLNETGSSRVAGGFDRVGRAMDRTGQTGKRVAQTITRNWQSLYNVGSRLVGVFNGLGAGLSAKKILDFDDALGQLQVETGKSNAYMMNLRNNVLATGAQYGVSKDKIAEFIQILQDQGGHFDLATRLMKRATMISKATGAEMSNLASIAAALKNNLNWSDSRILDYFARLNAQAISGTLNFKKMSQVAAPLIGAAANTNQDVGKLGAMMQTVGNVFGGKQNQARTAVVAMLDQLQMKSDKIKKTLGVDIFAGIDPKTGKKKLRDVEAILIDIFKKTKGDVGGKKGLAQIFSRSSLKAITALSGSFDFKTGRFGGQYKKSLDAYNDVEKGSMKTQLQRRQTGIAAESERLKRAMASLEQKFQTLGKKLAVWVSQNLGKALGIGAAGLAAYKLGPKLLGWIAGKFAGGGAAGGAGMLGVQKVWVMNPGFGGTPGAPGAPGAGTAAKVFGGIAAGAAGYAAGTYLDRKLGLSDKLSDTARGGLRGAASAVAVQRHTDNVAIGTIQRQAATFAAIAQRAQAGGRQTFQYTGAGGQVQTAAATQAGAAQALQAAAKKEGVQLSTADALKIIAQNIKVEVNASGLDKPSTQVTRGTPQ
ncbi:MAG: phage tail tape measure protein [Myxococcales bacterium]|nr:phage tail tape measure protein [Myxococcales bacterium]